ncbi:mediator complex subunit MED7 NDAI_0G03850 [Naumovozyma dairenensis CBS 421]|uniref:Mediator of RNA polymerase II transcription subunit 7 n=1 Tax=Naumovozyma dairenensis (strain ATCC 10597 / BCRC 20456 / CBS 421 / NBRC 0211 / NRRL Y-12639) TaxID=1071378 RepID=G0WEF1_NAUDC|nr:hypothetical protein NDAI_0G03850 [Naumovozyma dairenensis CBS 421]CCD26162.2 hypothetical protein NDAI_0G03850 [Naumovozyma dairenensis CBS 421]
MSGNNEDANAFGSLYPPPPPYIKFFTEENLSKLPEYQKLKKSGTIEEIDANKDTNDDTETITSELDFLIPPEMPRTQQYRAFGNIWQVKDQLPDLGSMGITQLYKTSNEIGGPMNYQYKIEESRKLLKSLLLNYLELIGILSINPELYEKRWKIFELY